MERLTVNKPVSEMNMVELAHNCCYIAEDGSTSYRDFSQDVDIRDFARGLLRVYAAENYSEEDTAFDEEMMEELKYNPEIYPSALIALLYRNMWAMAELRERLKMYEDAKEQGLLLRLPCKKKTPYWIFDRQYWIDEEKCRGCGYYRDLCTETFCDCYEDYPKCTQIVEKVFLNNLEIVSLMNCIGETVFLTKEEAEQKLAEMKGGTD